MRRDWLIWAATRAFVLGIIAGIIPWPAQVNDLTIYGDWAAADLSAGRFPEDPMWQYPPLAGPLLLLGWQLPGVHLGYALLFLAFDAVTMALVSARARVTGMTEGRLLWAAVPVVTGPLLLARFDVVPTALAVAACLAAATRPALSGGVAAVGAWLKVWPALAILGLRRRQLPVGILAAGAVSLVIVLVLLVTWTDTFSFLGQQRDRGLQIESVAAWPFLISRAVGGDISVVYQYGAHEVVGPGVTSVASLCVVLSLLLLAVVALQRLRGALDDLTAADVVLAATLFTVVTSRVFSGQYFIWLLGLAAVSLSEPTTRMRRVTALLIVAGLATHLVYPWLYSALLAGSWWAVAVQTVRIACTVAATALALMVLLRAGTPAAAGASKAPTSSVGDTGG